MIALWMDEGMDEESKDMKKEKADNKKGSTAEGCAFGRIVCCGKHKNGQCACQKQGRERD